MLHPIAQQLRAAGLDVRVVGTGGGCEAVQVMRPGADPEQDSHLLITDDNYGTPDDGGPWAIVGYDPEDPAHEAGTLLVDGTDEDVRSDPLAQDRAVTRAAAWLAWFTKPERALAARVLIGA